MRLEVRTTAGGCAARIVPSSGIVIAGLGEQLEEEGLELVVGAVELVDQQHGRAGARGARTARRAAAAR